MAAGAVGAAACGALGLAAPAAGSTVCPFRAATGVPCPLCGVTRSLLALGDGDIERAWGFAPLGPAVLTVSLVFLIAAAVAAVRRKALQVPRWLPVTLLAAVAVSWAIQLSTPPNPI